MGFESVVVLEAKKKDICICLYIKKIPGGYYTAKAYIPNTSWLRKNGYLKGSTYQESLFEGIRNFANGTNVASSTGSTAFASMDSINVRFTGGRVIEFVITEDNLEEHFR